MNRVFSFIIILLSFILGEDGYELTKPLCDPCIFYHLCPRKSMLLFTFYLHSSLLTYGGIRCIIIKI